MGCFDTVSMEEVKQVDVEISSRVEIDLYCANVLFRMNVHSMIAKNGSGIESQ